VVAYDYVDSDEPMLARMSVKREAGYRSLGYDVVAAANLFSSLGITGTKDFR
jgi:hypothetical protein